MEREELFAIASRFRSAIESADLSENSVGREASLRMRDFPHGACAEASDLFSIFLTERFELSPLVAKGGQIEEGEKWFGTHEWLKHNDLVIDITADQFEMVDDRVIVSKDSAFHNKYVQKEFDYDPHFILANHEPWKRPLYEKVVEKYDQLDKH